MTRLKTFWHEDGARTLQTWLTTALFATVISVFFLRLLRVPMPSMMVLGGTFLVTTLFIYLLLRLWKIWGGVLVALSLLLGAQMLLRHPVDVPLIGLSWWKALLSPMGEAVRWTFTEVATRGLLPSSFMPSFYAVVSLTCVLTLWVLPIPILNMFLLIGPLFYIEDLAQDPSWFVFLMLGLFCVYTSYAYRQDPDRHDQRPPLLFGSLLMALTVTFSLLLSPETFFNQDLSNRLNEAAPTQDQGEITSFSLSEVGFYPQGNLHVGGPVTPSDEPYMEVIAGANAFYLRGSAYDQFNGSTWSLTAAQNLSAFDINPDFYDTFDSPQSQVFWFADAQARDRAFRSGLFEPAIYREKTQKPTRIVFHGGKVVSLTHLSDEPTPEMSTDEVLSRLNTGDHFYYAQSGMMAGERAYDDFGLVVSDYVPPIANLWRTDIQKALQFEQHDGPRAYEATVRRDDPELAQILYDSDADFPTRYQMMRDHFEAHYAYALDVPTIPDEQNFIDHFLTNKRGYCVYFATAYSVLLADIGYETRYAEGFVVPQSDVAPGALSARAISANQAHAWCEMYLDGIGWIPVEATPTTHVSEISHLTGDQVSQTPPETVLPEQLTPESSESGTSESTETSEATSEPTNSTESSESTEAPLDTAEPEETEAPEPKTEASPHWKAIVLPLLAVLMIVLGVILRYRAWKKRSDPTSLNLAGDTPQARFEALTRHVRRYAQLNDLSLPPSATMPSAVMMMQQILTQYTDASMDVDGVTRALEELRYGSRDVDEADVATLYTWYQALDMMYRERTRGFTWLWNAVITAPGHPWQ